MNWTRVPRFALLVSTVVSTAALLPVARGGDVILALQKLFGLAAKPGEGVLNVTLLGFTGVVIVYAMGIVLSASGRRWPKLAATAILPLGIIAFVFAGAIAKVFGIVVVCVGRLVFFALSRRRSA